jgi:hypothetical protein
LIVMLWVWPGLLTTSIPSSEMVNVWGDVFEMLAMDSVSPMSTVTFSGSKTKSFWSTVMVAAWPVPGPRMPPATRAAIVITAIAEGTHSCRAGLNSAPLVRWSPDCSGPRYYGRGTGGVWIVEETEPYGPSNRSGAGSGA